MELIAILSNREDETVHKVKELLYNYTVYPVCSLDELEDLYSNIPLSLLIIDSLSYPLSSMEDFLRKLDDDTVVLFSKQKPDAALKGVLPASVYGFVNPYSMVKELPVMVDRAMEKQRLKNELRLLKQSTGLSVSSRQTPSAGILDGQKSKGYLHEKVLVSFAKMLSVNFDMQKLFNHFIDSVMEIARVSRMSIMLKDKDAFYIENHYGLDPYIAENLKLRRGSALVARLTSTGRILEKPVAPEDKDELSIRNDMKLLRCSFSFPMIHKGRLIGIFNLDNKITAEPFTHEELEVIYVLCNYLAAAVKDFDLYNKMWYQKEFTKNILSSMNSGIIVINKDRKITIFNQQAANIIGLIATDAIGSSISILPSPLRDILHETMVSGSSFKRFEILIPEKELPLGVTSYRMIDEKQDPIGAGILFSDLSDSKRLEEEQRKAEKLEAVNSLMAKIAHEVRNPLTSIQTYAQLINEKYGDDDELNSFYKSSVTQSIQRLDGLIDKLVTFSITQDYNFYRENLSNLIDETFDYIDKNIPAGFKIKKGKVADAVFVNVDRKLFIKAIFYLVMCITGQAPEGTIISLKARVLKEEHAVEILFHYTGDELTRKEKQNLLRPMFDIESLTTELNLPISRKIIEKHKGSIDILSDKGGNTFLIRLPAIDTEKANISIDGGDLNG